MAQDMPPRGGYEPVQYKVRGTPPSRSEKIALYWMAFPSADAGPDMAPADLSSSADVSGRQTGRRNLPAKGFRPGILLLGAGAIMGFGWYKLIGGIREAKYVSYTNYCYCAARRST
ncbi:hypothetical protein E4U54_006274 [Claviceps lovelessii]|nr:hypothetical protein E4U54_006274 [Claviceps lovelessii]